MYPFNEPYWNVRDQRYWCKMWGFGFRGVKAPFLAIIQEGRCSTFEQEYNDWVASQSNPEQ